MKLQLPSVTAIALTDYKLSEHQQVLDKMCESIDFGGAKIIFDKEIKSDVNNWNRKVIYELWQYVDTDYAFLFHADGYIIHPELWNPKWLEYDYCGAPWPLPVDDYSYRDPEGNIQRVGNSVGLRSKRLMRLPTKLGLEWKSYYGNTNEDGFLCVHNRNILEEHGCVFMPFEESLNFGKEFELPEHKGRDTFCFHQAI